MSNFWEKKTVLITGHTGFKGSWLSYMLLYFGAKVHGISLPPTANCPLFDQLDLDHKLESSNMGDLRDEEFLEKKILEINPEIIFHLAAQPLVNKSYDDPIDTYSTNVTGTLNLLQCTKKLELIKTIVVVTTDKCYENQETERPYKECDKLGGYDPYSSSKACAEILVSSWYRSFLRDRGIGVATARAGNVIGGGDFATDRLVPDIIRAFNNKLPIQIRNANSTRPWQHVIEPLNGYLVLAEKLHLNPNKFSKAFNFGPDTESIVSVNKFVNIANYNLNKSIDIEFIPSIHHEAGLLSLDIGEAKKSLNWHPKWSLNKTIKMTLDWYINVHNNNCPKDETMKQIKEYYKNG
jgi:CDP-glucose 4,6-dehydratase